MVIFTNTQDKPIEIRAAKQGDSVEYTIILDRPIKAIAK
jgi:hypothetical protein